MLLVEAFILKQHDLDESNDILNVESVSTGHIRLREDLGVFYLDTWMMVHSHRIRGECKRRLSRLNRPSSATTC